ncbi:MAG: restriction endonuclease subunit S [Methylococcaceae bacterium]|nr:restriction endonuclease subunit S [Methylococcaceae bacterium]
MSELNPYEYVTVPDGWECKRLIDCTEDKNISYGIVQPGQHVDDGIPVIRVNNVNNGQLQLLDVLKVSPETESKYKRTRLKGGEVLLTLVGSTGQSFVAPKQLSGWNVPRAIAVIRARDDVGADWINLCLQSQETKHFLDVRANTTVQKTLNLKDVRDIPILIPPHSIKESIENMALSLSNKIELNRQINQTLEQMAQALFKSWFVDFDPVKAKISAKDAWINLHGAIPATDSHVYTDYAQSLCVAAMSVISGKTTAQLEAFATQNPEQYQSLKATADLFPDAMQDSELGDVPEGWEVGNIGALIKAKGGYAFKSKDFQKEGFPVIKIKNINISGVIDTSNCQCVGGELSESAKRFRLNNGDILMAMTGATVGKTGVYVSDGRHGYLNQRVAIFKTLINGVDCNWYAFNLLTLLPIYEQIVSTAQGSAQPNISSSGIELIKVIIPDSTVILKYQSLMTSSYVKWMNNIQENYDLGELRDTLLPKLLSGELNVSH